MILTIKRQSHDATTILGVLFVDGVRECYTLENAALAIPAGTYRAEIFPSPHFGYSVVRLLDVPGRDAIEIHPGNSAAATHGCICVGTTETHDWIGESIVAFHALMLKVAEPLTVTVEDVPDPPILPSGEATGSP